MWVIASIFGASMVTYSTLDHWFIRVGSFWYRIEVSGGLLYVDLVLVVLLLLSVFISVIFAYLRLSSGLPSSRFKDVLFVRLFLVQITLDLVILGAIYYFGLRAYNLVFALFILVVTDLIIIWGVYNELPVPIIGNIRLKGIIVMDASSRKIIWRWFSDDLGEKIKVSSISQIIANVKTSIDELPRVSILDNFYGLFAMRDGIMLIMIFNEYISVLEAIELRNNKRREYKCSRRISR